MERAIEILEWVLGKVELRPAVRKLLTEALEECVQVREDFSECKRLADEGRPKAAAIRDLREQLAEELGCPEQGDHMRMVLAHALTFVRRTKEVLA